MITFIQNTSLITLLGLEDLTDNELDEIENEAASFVLTQSYNRLKNDTSLKIEERDYLTQLMQSPTIDEIIMNDLVSKFPRITDFIEQEGYIYKKHALIDQVNDFIDSTDIEFSEDEKNILNTLRDVLTNDGEKLSEDQIAESYINYRNLIDIK